MFCNNSIAHLENINKFRFTFGKLINMIIIYAGRKRIFIFKLFVGFENIIKQNDLPCQIICKAM